LGRILVVEDDASIREFIEIGLRERNHVVVSARSLVEAEARMSSDTFDLCILDRRLPDGDSLSLISMKREQGFETPILVLSAAGQIEQRIAGLDAGADDYMAKPFSVTELTARVRAILRRRPVRDAAQLVLGDMTVMTDQMAVRVGGRPVDVTANEWRFLILLGQRPGRVHSREAIMAQVGVSEDAEDVAVDHMVSRLRRKLKESGTSVEISTVRRLGFALGTRTIDSRTAAKPS
jgi:two-component system, OmpR family, response regulator